MGNRVYLELRGSELPILVEEDEEAITRLTCNNGLPLFWLALLQEKDLSGCWESGVRAVFADPDEFTLEPLRLGWREASANLALACDKAEVRLPELFPLLHAWQAGLIVLAAQEAAQEVRLYLAERTNFYESADGFLAELHRAVRTWHGTDQPVVAPITDPGYALTGFDWLTDAPFPATLPPWQPGRPVPGQIVDKRRTGEPAHASGRIAEWGMTVVFVVIVLGTALLGATVIGPSGLWVGGMFGVVVGVIVVWRWATWATSQ